MLQINSIGQLTIYYHHGGAPVPINETAALKLTNSNIYNLHESKHKFGNFASKYSSNNISLYANGKSPASPTSHNGFSDLNGSAAAPYRNAIIKNLHSSAVTFVNQSNTPIIQVVSVNKEKCYFKSINNEISTFVRFLASLMVWQNMNIYGIHNKYFSIPLPFANLNNPNNINTSTNVSQSIQLNDEDNEDNVIIINKEEKNLLVCRFKIYGPIPKTQRKNLEVQGPHNPLYPLHSKEVNEGWFYAMGVIKSNGILDLLSEYDGTLLYSINISCLIRSEIRQVHHSIFENSNILFVGVINQLRESNLNHNICPTYQKPSFFIPSPVTKFNELRNFATQRILIDFPLHIDLEDWYVALNSLAAREYVGINSQYSARSSLRISKKLHVDILEANFEQPVTNQDDEQAAVNAHANNNNNNNNNSSNSSNNNNNNNTNTNNYHEYTVVSPTAKLYSDILFWDSTWARTSIVESSRAPFWREEFDFELPILTSSLSILIKKCTFQKPSSSKKNKKHNSGNNNNAGNSGNALNGHPEKVYSDKDLILGVVSVSEELIETSDNKETWVAMYSPETGLPIGQICLRLSLKEWHILPPSSFDVLQKMLLSTSLEGLIQFLGANDLTAKYEDLEEISNMMLDIFQALHKEELWFSELIDYELKKVGVMLRGNRQSLAVINNPNNTPNGPGLSMNFFNTLFRGNSILTKTFEKYNLRVGQEFLEKVVGEFVLQVAEDNYECEIDPARIRTSTTEEKEFILDDNFMRLFEYVELIWSKIYNSCNDVPVPIRKELEIFRNKLEAACDPNDPKTSSLALNCITGFLFLRLICPAILNPKLFFLIKDHQTGNIKRTLTLVSKILLTLSNRQKFGAKEPWLIKMNYFLEQHEVEMLDYLDIITNRKLDQRPKILDLSDTVTRPDISISPQISAELPTNPFLIDKYLRLTQLADILAAELLNQQDEFNFENSAPVAISASAAASKTGGSNNVNNRKRNSFRNSYKIGSSAFEEQVMKNNNLAFASEELLKNISQLNNKNSSANANSRNNRISSNISGHSQVSLNDLKQESYLLLKKINGLDHLLTSFENPSLIYGNWGKFVNNTIETSLVDHRKRLLYSDDSIAVNENNNLRKLSEDGVGFLKFKFNSRLVLDPLFGVDAANIADNGNNINGIDKGGLDSTSKSNGNGNGGRMPFATNDRANTSSSTNTTNSSTSNSNNSEKGSSNTGSSTGNFILGAVGGISSSIGGSGGSGGPPKLSKLIKSSSSNTLINNSRRSLDDLISGGGGNGNGGVGSGNSGNDGNRSPFKKTFFWRKKN